MDKSENLIKKMNEGEDISILFVKATESLEYYEKRASRFDATERERLHLLKENNILKEELGRLLVVKQLMKRANIYGYEDLLSLRAKKRLKKHSHNKQEK